MNNEEQDWKLLYDYLTDFSVATEQEIILVSMINGTTVQALNDILYARTGYRDLEQILESEEE